MAERVLVIGAGIAGLCVALALAPTGREVVLLERDPEPPDGSADTAFAEWERRGVGHLRHSHAFLARLRTIIRDGHPELLADLRAAGCRELGLDGMLTELHRQTYAPRPEDGDLVVLTSRRTTLELVIRRYVERLPGVEIRPETFVRRLLVERPDLGPPVVAGVSVDTTEGPRHLLADLVVDAGGRTSSGIEQLVEEGVRVREEAEPSRILYFTRHYRLLPGQAEPPRGSPPANGDLGFLKYGVFPGDNGHFSITLCLPEIEMELRKAVVRPETFDAICRQLPGPSLWIDPARAEGISRVFGMGDLQSRWRDLVHEGEPAVLGYFPVGDSLVRTNPLYGRGCSFAAVTAYGLRDALEAADSPAERLRLFHRKVHAELRPYYVSMRDQDRSSIRRARHTLTPGYRPDLRARLIKSFVEDGINIAVRSDPEVLREALRGFHMLEPPSAWLRRPNNLVRVLGFWARGKRRNAAAYPPRLGPDRAPLMQALGLSPQADIDRLRAETA